MSYPIPKNLTKYAEEFLFGLTIWQFLYLGVAIASSFLLFIKLKPVIPETWIRMVIIIPILILAVLLAFFSLAEKVKAQLNYKKSLRQTSYFDYKMNSIIDVEEIDDNIVLLKNGIMIGIVEVKPIDFFILSEEKQKSVLNSYNEWMMGIDYPMQIISRSVDIDVDSWVKNLAERQSVKENEQHFSIFSKWIREEIGKQGLRNRIFYILIQEKTKLMQKRPIIEEIKAIFTGEFSFKANKESDEYQNSMKNLRNNVINCIEILEKCGLKSRRLETDELLGLYSSYFTSRSVIKRELTPLMWHSEEMAKKQDILFERLLTSEKSRAHKQIGYQGS